MFRNVSRSGNFVTSAPNPPIIIAIAAIKAERTPIPIKAAGPRVPTTPKIRQAADKPFRSITKLVAIGISAIGSAT